MAFVGTAELILFEIGVVAFVGLAVPQFARVFTERRYKYGDLTNDIGWAPPAFLFGLVWSLMYLILLPLAVYRVRLLGNWLAGVNLSALVVFWILQFVLVAYNFLYIVSLWAGFVVVLVAFGLAIATTWLFFGLDTFAGVLMIPLDVWLLFATLLALVIAVKNRSVEPVVGFMKNQATLGGLIGQTLPAATAATASSQQQQRRVPLQQQQSQRARGQSQPAPRVRQSQQAPAEHAAPSRPLMAQSPVVQRAVGGNGAPPRRPTFALQEV